MEKQRVVLKFGGSVIPNEFAVVRVADTVKELSSKYNIISVVVSAMGKTTNNLDALAHRTANNPDKRELDALLATGEMQSAALVAMRLNAIGVPARSYNAGQFGIKTDNNFGDAKIEKITMKYVNHLYGIPVVAGFQGITESGDITTLGREGSDISAVVVAAALSADFCWLFKDGGGIYEKNPKTCVTAKLFKEISYTKMLDLLDENRGGRVLHKRSVQLAQKYKMPLFVSSMSIPEVGTWIKERVHPKTR